jgi:hypothetical protein
MATGCLASPWVSIRWQTFPVYLQFFFLAQQMSGPEGNGNEDSSKEQLHADGKIVVGTIRIIHGLKEE